MRVYLDTNIFIYLSDRASIYHKACNQLVILAEKQKIILITSVETLQEIVHYSLSLKKPTQGLLLVKEAMSLVDELLSVDRSTIDLYVKLIEKNLSIKNISSRDMIHIACALQNDISALISYDKRLKKLKEVNCLRPEEVIY